MNFIFIWRKRQRLPLLAPQSLSLSLPAVIPMLLLTSTVQKSYQSKMRRQTTDGQKTDRLLIINKLFDSIWFAIWISLATHAGIYLFRLAHTHTHIHPHRYNNSYCINHTLIKLDLSIFISLALPSLHVNSKCKTYAAINLARAFRFSYYFCSPSSPPSARHDSSLTLAHTHTHKEF